MFCKLLLVAAVATATNEAAFKGYMATYAKTYTGALYEQRLAAFLENDVIIATHNALDTTYKLGHNDKSDLTNAEFNAIYLATNFTRPIGNEIHDDVNTTASADAIDWTTKDAVTAVKDQAQCGSCWAFSTTGSLEGAFAIKNGKLTSFSEEQLVECDKVDDGCNGGLMDNGFKFITKNGGLCTEESYPYTSGTGKRGLCKKSCKIVAGSAPTSFKDVAMSDAAMVTALNLGPVSIAIEADKSAFQLYKSGVLSSKLCGTKLDHGVLAVGYGTDSASGKDFYKVKNSWGGTWGMEGYILLEKGAKAGKKGMCGLLSGPPSYPIL